MAETKELAIGTIMNSQVGTALSSIDVENASIADKKKVFNAMNNPSNKLSDFINKKIKVENIYIETAEYLNDETGEIEIAPRIVLISPDGDSYFTSSKGVLNSLKNVYAAFGSAPWKGGLEFEVKQRAVGKGKALTLEMV